MKLEKERFFIKS